MMVSTSMTYNFGPNVLVPSARVYVENVLSSIKYRGNVSTSGYWVHGHVYRFMSVVEFALSRETLTQLWAIFMNIIRKGLLNVQKMNGNNVPKFDFALWFDKGSSVWS